MLQSDTVLSLGSFSKILAPGMRLGWIQTSPRLRDRLLENGFINSGGSINHISSHIVRLAIQLGLQDTHLQKLRTAYRSRVEAMDDALQSLFGDLAHWTRPAGGYFFWLKFAEAMDTAPLRDAARKREAGFQPGSVFSCEGRLRNYLRLSFAHYNEDDIREGLRRIRPLFD
jgi:DNA-binding transcriptional MocR family regulator